MSVKQRRLLEARERFVPSKARGPYQSERRSRHLLWTRTRFTSCGNEKALAGEKKSSFESSFVASRT
jgi:hypothetical protein